MFQQRITTDQGISLCPKKRYYKKTFKALSKTQVQIEDALKEAIGKRQKNRAAVLDVLGQFVNEQKQIQNNVLKILKLNNRKIS